MKLLISESQLRNILETEYNFHKGGDFKDITNIEPYGSDTIFRMDGRGTGHFGSGVYFSTYNIERWEKDSSLDEYRKDDGRPEFIKIKNGVYRVDFDLYKNLFRVRNAIHGDYLFKTLKLANGIFYSNINYSNGVLNLSPTLSTRYLILKNNLDKLGLRIPKYRDFIRMMETASHNLKDRKDWRSFSTRIMEYNGFNGVNVSGIHLFDNTMHGSVIYDMSKVSNDIVKVNDNIDFMTDIKDDVVGNWTDKKIQMLRGEMPYESLNDEDKNYLIKRFPKFIKSYYLDKYFNEKERKMYYRFLKMKLRNRVIREKPNDDVIDDIISNGYSHIIYDPEIKFDDQTFLEYVLSEKYGIKFENKRTLLNNINRELSGNEKRLYDMVKEDVDYWFS
jgi:glycerol-3-phosphate cytidylyltransferase-like family protein